MDREYFFAYLTQLQATMESFLEHSKTVGYPIKPYCEGSIVEYITIPANYENEEELRDKIDKVHELMQKKDTEMVMEGSTEQNGRYDDFDAVTYIFSTKVIRDEITTAQVEESMKNYVRKQLGMESWELLECKVMQLFKDGFITWREVQEAHNTTECKL